MYIYIYFPFIGELPQMFWHWRMPWPCGFNLFSLYFDIWSFIVLSGYSFTPGLATPRDKKGLSYTGQYLNPGTKPTISSVACLPHDCHVPPLISSRWNGVVHNDSGYLTLHLLALLCLFFAMATSVKVLTQGFPLCPLFPWDGSSRQGMPLLLRTM